MILQFMGPVRVGGGSLVVLAGAPPFAGVVWRLAAGAGTLTPLATHADASGLAGARYDAAGASAGASIRVEADVYA